MWSLVEFVMGSVPDEFKFLYIFGVVFILYIFLGMFKLFIDIMKDFTK